MGYECVHLLLGLGNGACLRLLGHLHSGDYIYKVDMPVNVSAAAVAVDSASIKVILHVAESPSCAVDTIQW